MLARYFVEEADADAAQDRGPGAGVAAAVGGGAPVPGSFRRRLSGLT